METRITETNGKFVAEIKHDSVWFPLHKEPANNEVTPHEHAEDAEFSTYAEAQTFLDTL